MIDKFYNPILIDFSLSKFSINLFNQKLNKFIDNKNNMGIIKIIDTNNINKSLRRNSIFYSFALLNNKSLNLMK